MTGHESTAAEIGRAVRQGQLTARAVTEAALARIAQHNPAINAFTIVTSARARATADAIDRRVAAGGDPGPLAGVPFAAKNLFDALYYTQAGYPMPPFSLETGVNVKL